MTRRAAKKPVPGRCDPMSGEGFLRASRPVPALPLRVSRELLRAAHDGDVALTEALLRRPEVDADAADEYGRVALHEAVRHERVEVVQQLLVHGVDLDCARQSDGCTALMTAARDGAVAVLGMLLEAGADWRLRNGDGETAAEMAQAAHEALAVAALELWEFQHGTSQERAQIWARQLMDAANTGDSEGVAQLLQADGVRIDINQADEDGRIALNEAARHNHVAVIQQLVEAGADVNARRPVDGWTPLISATYYGATDAVQALLELGADWSATNNDGTTALDIAQFPWRTALEFEKWQAERPTMQLLADKQTVQFEP